MGKTKITLRLRQRMALLDYYERNHQLIIDQGLSQEQFARRATRELDFMVTAGHIAGIVRTESDKPWPHTPKGYPTRSEDLRALCIGLVHLYSRWSYRLPPEFADLCARANIDVPESVTQGARVH